MIGAGRLRTEDARLVRGHGHYVDDLRVPGSLHCAIVRSRHAHAGLRAIDGTAALQQPGVVGVFRAADLPELRRALPSPQPSGMTIRPHVRPVLADERVRYVGEPVAVVVAVDRFAAEDAAAMVRVDYDPVDAVVTATQALAPGAPVLHPDWDSNLAGTIVVETGDIAAAMAAAVLVIERRLVFHRLAATSLEPRAVLGRWDEVTETLELWSTTQAPHRVREHVANALGLHPGAVRVRAKDVGGGFGPKGQMHPEEQLVAALARRLRRAVRWTDTRIDSFVSTMHAGDQVHRIRLGLDREGRFLGLEDDFLVDGGAYLPAAGIAPNNTATHLMGLYRFDAFRCRGRVAVTNKVPATPYRGAGRSEAVFAVERCVDLAARELGLDPADLRRRNLLRPHELPHARGFAYRDGRPVVYDRGDFPALLERALERAGYHEFRRTQAAARERGRLVGVGIATYTEGTGIGPHEGATVTLERSGHVTVTVAVSGQGQSHETTLAQVCADRLAIPVERITVTGGDTGRFPAFSSGTNASRVGVIVGNAVAAAAAAVRERIFAVAARVLECDPRDLVIDDDRVHVKGARDQGMLLSALALRAEQPDMVQVFGEPGVTATRFHAPDTVTWAPGAHVAVVEIDRDTGAIALLAYTAVHDSGRSINPMVVEGQILGGATQGFGMALSEEIVYDEAGQILTGSLMEYGLPRADTVPPVDVTRMEWPSDRNPLGVKGTGHGAAIPPAAAIANAVADALAEHGADITEIPIRPETIWALIHHRERQCPRSKSTM